MDQRKPPLGVIQGGGGATPWRSAKFGIELPMPPPPIKVDDEWRRIYIWLCDQLIGSKRDITAAAMQLTLLVDCIRAWAHDRALCEKDGRYATSKEGNRYELPHSYNERKGAEQLKRDLPEACMTVMSQVEARLKESKIGEGGQDDLFGDLVAHGRSRPSAA
ncbi:hypothetical protein [Achromobacter denitrificans]|uniref:hypothetical protein n=1 Tax=Achromobacter denitrificans TaxID=32002 RepID=UPI000B48EFED|nr:hypothetical protein [Achromobacter denitrificans]